ncbi:hypothetical protein [Shewanella algae]|uniref:hypothetical protein n=1 Tax=Shewanella algae TaxID=38313 RepID=UPI001183C6B8|nr:hypothetical protein [Shewanella algae]MBO2579234.1 hypothetical protein [Shewanella algae]MBO2684687.1 hypothetical protein [Shewanella algae]TVL01302.1 hypothetical protein AYI82_21905 [Shewanella algae]BCV64274.1 hypothetical protein TUM17386_39450 [Shewanella algae]
MQSDIQNYIAKGFKPTLVNQSGLGAVVLSMNNTVVKFGQDPAYDAFINYAMPNSSPNLPKIFNHALPKGPFPANMASLAYTRTEMELLDELSVSEAQAYDAWIKQALPLIIQGSNVASDPFNLLIETTRLVQEAQRLSLGLDLYQSKNIMKRSSTGDYVHIDPFN